MPASNRHDVSKQLADFITNSSWDELPVPVQHAAKRSLLNGFATALAGCRDQALDISVATLLPFSGMPKATLIGRSEKSDMLTAAFINAAAMNVHDYDDTHIRTVIHPTAPVAPALLALSEHRPMSGKVLLHALALGIETACRVGNAVSPEHYARGWHITSSCGVFGAAAATGKVIGLDLERMRHALGVASAQSSGLLETLGFMAKSAGVGGACRGGLLAALLAENGMGGPERPLEGPRGFLHVTAESPSYGYVTDNLGSQWEVLKNIHKPYPCGVVLFPVIDACLGLKEKHDISPDEIESITLHGHPLLRQRTDRPNVATGREAQVSAQHAVSVCFLIGSPGLEEFSDATVQLPSVLAFRERVSVVEDPNIEVAGVRLEMICKDGQKIEITIDHARGTDEGPLTDTEIEEKFKALTEYGAPACKNATQIIDHIWNLDDLDDVSQILYFARPVDEPSSI